MITVCILKIVSLPIASATCGISFICEFVTIALDE